MSDKATDAEFCTTLILGQCFEGKIICKYYSYKGSETKLAYRTTALSVKISGMNYDITSFLMFLSKTKIFPVRKKC